MLAGADFLQAGAHKSTRRAATPPHRTARVGQRRHKASNMTIPHCIWVQWPALSVAEGVLLQLEDLVLADAFANLLEQAKYLLGQGYFLASGVILRAVLEERLRRLSDRHGLTLSKPKPTLSDYNTELYRAGVYGKVTFKDVESLVAVGNAAAHKDTGITFQQNVSIQI